MANGQELTLLKEWTHNLSTGIIYTHVYSLSLLNEEYFLPWGEWLILMRGSVSCVTSLLLQSQFTPWLMSTPKVFKLEVCDGANSFKSNEHSNIHVK